MKKSIILLSLLFTSIGIFAQSWQQGTNTLYVTSGTNVGIGTSAPNSRLHIDGGSLRIGSSSTATDRSVNFIRIGDGDYIRIGEWEKDDMLSFKATKYKFTQAKVGIGVEPDYALDIMGKIYLRTYDHTTWNNSYFHWAGHSLIMGSPVGMYAYNSVDLKPGGSTEGPIWSQLRMYTASSANTYVERVSIRTEGHVWFNTAGNFGIGTTNPQYKLDVAGCVHAEEILVSVPNGADFVFGKDYHLRPLNDVAIYVSENQHLPEIPSEVEMQENGVNVIDFQVQLLQKVEELTLYLIEQNNEIERLKQQIELLTSNKK